MEWKQLKSFALHLSKMKCFTKNIQKPKYIKKMYVLR